ncbi:Putative NADPH-quinone reductase (modulator of drug activity B) [Enhydrobacter aerosaccus]|uniref:Putative NADPH-quinone reductase (Modulator of drug activity B) n=1 Tax=Enhydrobacter aerosaccus TaxID=225324 RepID=A0A1T4JRR1_9HYPH|nr:NAD(P)H-dependent oxidoreductase [Enhydrobacter aerosaccus]SJZ32814.1 Putative NADPH-quinone reductase (modulator of drug activity B) [Enhydrobacter aerosaccus]
MSRPVRTILILNGHPDAKSKGLCHALATTYGEGAREAGRTVQQLDVAGLDFGFVSSQAEYEKGTPPLDIAAAQDQIRTADHLVVIYPMWLGDMPAILKAFLEQTLRPGFAFTYRPNGFPQKHLTGRSARIIVTMGMPAAVYRWFYRAHGLKNLKRNILRFVGFGPVHATLLGSVGTCGKEKIQRRLAEVKELGRRGI